MIKQRRRELLRDPRGATAVEYGLICALIVLVMLTGLYVLAGTTISMWNNVSAKQLAVSPS
jgi:pilus assembly protein Flp/PilA